MKARIVQTTPLALLYGVSEAHPAWQVLAAQGIAAKPILPAQLSSPVGLLAGGSGKAAAPDTLPPPDTQLLLMADFTPAARNGLLNALRTHDAPIALKAVVTKTNRTWSVRALLEELQQEHDEWKKREQA